MGKHSRNKGVFGPDGVGHGGPRPAKRKPPSVAAGKRPVTSRVPRAHDLGSERAYKQPRPGQKRGQLEAAPARLRAERDRRMGRTKRIAAIVGICLLAAIFVSGVGLYAYAKHIQNTMQRTVFQKEKLNIDLKPAKPMEPYNVLILGFDKRPRDTVFRSDSMILARVDPKTKQVWLVSIPRDMRAQVPGHGYTKVNNAYALGKEQLAIDTVEKLTGQKINYYMGVDFTGFRQIVNAMGGVWIDVPVEINDRQADPSKGKKYSHIDAGYQLLDGNHAITFVRARHQFADQDFTRMKNQQRFFKAIADQIATKTSVAKIPRIVSTAAPYISTNMTLIEMLRTAQALKGSGSDSIQSTTLPGSWRTPFIWPDEVALETIMDKFEAGEPFEPKKSKSKATSSGSEQDAEAKPQAKKPSEITVTVRNGGGVAGCAKQASSILKAQAFKVDEVGNANQFVYKKTLVIYKKDKPSAELVLSSLPSGTKLVESRGMYSFKTDVLVVIGKDWDISKVPVTPVTAN